MGESHEKHLKGGVDDNGNHGRRWAGWIAFAGWLMVIIAAIDFFEGLIAVIRDQYYLFGPNQVIVFDMTKWGWFTMIWGIILGLAGLGLLAGSTWARWFTIVVASINVLGQLGTFGSAAYPLWALCEHRADCSSCSMR